MFSSFMVNTWIVATIVAAVAGFVGFFVVIRGSSFAAHALPLGTFPGAAAASLIGVNQLFGLIVFAGLGVVGISHLGRRGRHDVATALCLVTLLGLGALFLSMTSEYSQEVYSLLFGEVLGISTGDVAPIAAVSALSIAITAMLFRPLLLSSVSPELGEASGRVGPPDGTVVPDDSRTCHRHGASGGRGAPGLQPDVGPAAAARSVTDRPLLAMLLSVCFALFTVWAAIALSYVSNWPVGFFVGGLGAISYGLGRAWAWMRIVPQMNAAGNAHGLSQKV